MRGEASACVPPTRWSVGALAADEVIFRYSVFVLPLAGSIPGSRGTAATLPLGKPANR